MFQRTNIIFFVLILGMSSIGYGSGRGVNDFQFIENKGQWGNEILFVGNIPGGNLLIKKDRLVYRLMNAPDKVTNGHLPSHFNRSKEQSFSEMDVSFLGASSKVNVIADAVLPFRYNYYLGNDSEKWGEDCLVSEAVIFEDLYEGIDLKFYVSRQGLKYDFNVKQGADPNNIKLSYKSETLPFLEGGCSFISLGDNSIMERAPVAYTVCDDQSTEPVQCTYRLTGNQLSFDVASDYDRSYQLVIDPELIFSTFSGAHSDNFGYTACYDEEGNFYSGGIVFGSGFPSTVGTNYWLGTDMGILKYDSTGSHLLYGTFVGGASEDAPHSMVVNHAGELIILGTSGSISYPVTNGTYDSTFNGGEEFAIFNDYVRGTDIVLTILDADGHIKASTYAGGDSNDGILKMENLQNYVNGLIINYGDYHRGDVIVDAEDNIYVASHTESENFPSVSPVQQSFGGGISDAVIFSMNKDLTNMRWSTFLGGTREDGAYTIKLLDKDKVVVAGGTMSSDFPTTSDVLHITAQGSMDGFISILDYQQVKIDKSTYLGTSNMDQVYFIDLDDEQNIYAFGLTNGVYPVSGGDIYSVPNSSQFIHKLNPGLNRTLFSTVFGDGTPAPNISPTAFAVSNCGGIMLSGWGGDVNKWYSHYFVGSTDYLEVTNDAYMSESDGSDFYLMVLSDDGKELVYATFFGSTNNGGDHVDGGTSRFDKRGIIYQAACSCGGSHDNFPTTEGAWSRVNNGVNAEGVERCNNAAVKFQFISMSARFETYDFHEKILGYDKGCTPLDVLFVNKSSGGLVYTWDFGDGDTFVDSSKKIKHTFDDPGTYVVTLTSENPYSCEKNAVYSDTINVYESNIQVNKPPVVCKGESVQLSATGAATYQWSPTDQLDDPTSPTPIATVDERTFFNLTAITKDGCVERLQVIVDVYPVSEADFTVDMVPHCDVVSYKFNNQTAYGGGFQWDFGDGEVSNEKSPMHTFSRKGSYNVILSTNHECIAPKSMKIEYSPLKVPNVFTPNNDGKNDLFEITSVTSFSLVVFDREGKVVYKNDNYENDWDASDVASGIYFYDITLSENNHCSGWLQILR